MLAVLGSIATGSAAIAADEAPAADAKVEATAATQAELQDGTKIEIDGANISVVGADGSKTPAPDGTHTLKDSNT